MAQADLFSNYANNLKNINSGMNRAQVSQREMISLLEDALEKETSIAEVKRKILKGDYEGYNILKKIESITKSIYKSMKSNKEQKQDIKTLERQLEILEEQNKNNKITQDLYLKIKKNLEVQKVTSELILNQQRRSIPILGKMGKLGNFISDAFVNVSDVLGAIGSVIGTIMGAMFKLGKMIFSAMLSPLKKAFNTFLELQSTVGNLAANIGMTNKESRYLLNNMSLLTIQALKYGGSMKDVATIFQTFSAVTGKNRFFSKEEIAALTELGLGTGLGVEGAAQLAASFDNIGISLDKTIKLTDKARNMAARYNVNTTAVLKTYNELVTSLTGIGFGKGLDNLTKLAAKAQAMRFDIVSSTKAFTDAFFEPDKAAQAAAQMQVLGGAFAQSFGDPMQLAYESMNDPTKLAEKYADLVKGMVTKTATGDFLISPAARKQLQLAAQTLGQDYEKTKELAIEQAKIADKMTVLSKAGFNLFGIKDDEKPALANLMKLNEKGQYSIRLPDGTDKLLSELTDKNQLKFLLDDRKKNEEAAIQRKTLVERLSLIVERFMLGFSKIFVKFNNILEDGKFMKAIENFGTSLAEKVIPLIESIFGDGGQIKNILKDTIDFITKLVGTLSDIFKGKDTIWKKIGDGISTMILGVWDFVSPYLEAGFAKLLQGIGKATGFETVENWGNKMLLDASSRNKRIYDMIDQKKRDDMVNQINQNKTDLSGKQLVNVAKGAGIGAAIGAGLFGIGTILDFTGIGAAFGLPMQAIGALLGGTSLIGASATGAAIGGLGTYGTQKVGNMINPQENYVAPQPPTTNVKDALITPHGIIKGDKGDIWAAFQPKPGGFNGGNQSMSINHTGTIRIESSDGKVVTWDQMHSARDMVGASMQSAQQTYNSGFGNYHNTNTIPIKPLV